MVYITVGIMAAGLKRHFGALSYYIQLVICVEQIVYPFTKDHNSIQSYQALRDAMIHHSLITSKHGRTYPSDLKYFQIHYIMLF